VNILVINLPKSVDRLDFQRKQLENLMLSFEVLDAFSKESIDLESFSKDALGWERPLRVAELACFMSHKAAWQRIIETQKPTLILEDDAILSKFTKDLLMELKHKKSFDMVTLEVRGRKKVIAKSEILTTSTNHKLYSLYQDRTGAAAYVLWPSGALKLIEKSRKVAPALADAFISSCYSLRAFQVDPAVAVQQDQCRYYGVLSDFHSVSTISSAQKPNYDSFKKATYLLYKYRRVYSQVKMCFRRISVVGRASSRMINLKKDHFHCR